MSIFAEATVDKKGTEYTKVKYVFQLFVTFV
jgi:hypothetical protein